jgi:hypothetical protein
VVVRVVHAKKFKLSDFSAQGNEGGGSKFLDLPIYPSCLSYPFLSFSLFSARVVYQHCTFR